MTTDELIERAARIIADAALDWTDIENGEHEHSPECANWQPYTHEARGVLAVFEQAQADPLDPEPWVVHSFDPGDVRVSHEHPLLGYRHNFEPREGFSQDRSRYQEVEDGRG